MDRCIVETLAEVLYMMLAVAAFNLLVLPIAVIHDMRRRPSRPMGISSIIALASGFAFMVFANAMPILMITRCGLTPKLAALAALAAATSAAIIILFWEEHRKQQKNARR